MPIVTPQNLSFFFTRAEMRFWMAYKMADTWWNRIATLYPWNTEIFQAGWIGALDGLHEWVGSRQVEEPAPQTYLVTLLPYEMTKGIDKYKFKHDQFGIYAPIFAFMGERAKKWPDYELRDLLQNKKSQKGTRQNGTDGLTHWHASHPVDFYDSSKGTYPNDYRGGVSIGGTTVGGKFTLNAFLTVWEDMSTRKDESGEAMGLLANMTMGPTQLKAPMDTVLGAQFFGAPVIGTLGSGSGANGVMVGSTENMARGQTDRMLNADLSSDGDTWYMMITDQAVKPFGFIVSEAPTFTYRIKEDDPIVFDKKQYLYGANAFGAPCWAPPFLSSISGT